MEIKISSFGSDFQKDSAMYRAIVENAPVWPQWERLSDTMALLPAPVCSCCEGRPAFSRVNGECLECFADAVAHGGEYSSIKALTEFIDDCQISNGDPALTRAERETIARVARTYGYGRKPRS